MRVDKHWWWIVLLAAAAAALFLAFDLGRFLTLDAVERSHLELLAWRRADPLWAGLVFFIGYVATAALSLPGAAVLTLAAGAVFGLGWGTLLVSFASAIGATLAMLVSRRLLRGWVQARLGARVAPVEAGVRRHGGRYLFMLRLVPLFPFFAVNLAMGLTSIRTWTFYWVSQVGMLAATLVYVNAGTQLARIDSVSGIVSPPVLAAFVLVGFLPLVARKLVDAVQGRSARPRWTKPKRFDRNLVVIGAGSAGLVTAYLAAAVRAKVTLVEKHRMGGDCLNTGCVPSKALIRSARFLSHVQRAKEFGMRSASAEFGFDDVMERVQRVIRTVAPHDSVQRFSELGVDMVQGTARIVSPWEVEVADPGGAVRRLTTRSIVIAAGARPFVPPLPGIDQIDVLTSDTVWTLRQRPERLLILGGGPIGCELAQAFARLGSRVTLVEMAPRLLPREDADVSALVAERFRREGIDVRAGCAARGIEVIGGQRLLIAAHDGREVRLPFDALLVALGRAANLSGYGLEELGLATDRTIEVNDYLQTSIPNIYAAGDVAGPFQFTHAAAHQAWHAAVNALLHPFGRFRADYRVMPSATFVDPEVARVGLNEQEATEAGVPYEVTVYGLDDLDRAIADEEGHGFVKVLTPPGKDRILGVTIVGEHAGDLLAEYVLAMRHGIGLNGILGTVHAYPTLAESAKYVAGHWKRAHAPRALLRWVGRFHAWRRG